jgi:membrane protein implicated in regulation of membrane protease activity
MLSMNFLLLQQQPTFWDELFDFLSEESLASILSWEFWLLATVVFLIGEVFTAGFLLGALMPGSLLAAIAAAFGLGVQGQLLVFAIGVLIGLFYLRPIFLRKLDDGSEPSNVDALIGSTAKVVDAIAEGEVGLVKVSSEEWRARSENNHDAGTFVEVVGIEGNTLVVK